MDQYIKLAKKSIKSHLAGQTLKVEVKKLPQEMTQKRAGVFVSLHKKDSGHLRGCIGTFLPTKDNLAQEIIDNARAAAFSDPRFPALKKDELDNLKIKVDVLNPPQLVKSKKELDPQKYGIIVKNKLGQVGLLLPDIAGIKTRQEQLSVAGQKAGFSPEENNYQIYRFTVTRHQ
ncbi:MAG: AmmeMemoRadiSam system protein A [Patescibacteria group bacterium]|nr:AmmeMemoRadiSam system protein A [Patescibacteria group bacterium]